MKTNFQQEYIEEAKQVLKSLQQSLLQMANKEAGQEEVNNVYRYLHTLKGSAGMFGYHEVERLSHELESVYSDIRDGIRQQDDFIIDLTLHAADVLSDLLDGKESLKGTNKIIADLGTIHDNTSVQQQKPEVNAGATLAFAILLRPDKEIYKRGINFNAILEEILSLGNSEFIVHNESIPFQTQIVNKEIISWFEIFLATTSGIDAVRDVLMFLSGKECDVLEVKDDVFRSDLYKKYLQLSEAEIESRNSIIRHLNPQFAIESVVENVAEMTAQVDSEDSGYSTIIRKAKKNGHISVGTQKLDQLINIVSELVIFRSELQHLMGEVKNPAIVEAMEKLERYTLRLRDSAFGIRLVPLNILNVKLQRLIRNVSQELGKEVEFITEGLDTELDRSMINALEAPLMHMIRNAIDHGIEMPAEREKRNKPRKGLLKFYSYNSGDHVFIQLQDDGNGIDFEKIRRRGIKKGVLQEGQTYSEKDLIALMMTPGFSTADKVSTVSGRGVGMDVVKKEIAGIRGEIEVSSEKGLGSIFTLRLPLTLTILDTLVVNVDDNKYLIPINEVEYCYEEEHKKLFSKKSRQITYEGVLTPFVSLREYFGKGMDKEKETVIVIKKNDTRIAVVVDSIVGKIQTVYKPLNELLHPADCFSGASILGDGTMALILNALRLKQ
jgi:two-component system, chemotaxis family, sensor kinase CheA